VPPQNGLGAAISSHFLKGRSMGWTRVAVLVINVPLIVLGARPGHLDLKVLDVSAAPDCLLSARLRASHSMANLLLCCWAGLGGWRRRGRCWFRHTPAVVVWWHLCELVFLPGPPQLFLLANMICCTSAIPVLIGLSSRLHHLIGGASMVFSCILSIFLTSGAACRLCCRLCFR
jgi:hypothetical protein